MDELLAIILIVIICCAMFLAWLISMAVCPDAVVDLINGNNSSDSPSLYAVNDKLFDDQRDDQSSSLLKSQVTNDGVQLNHSRRPLESKKLSVVVETDE
ncbi:hypothetical protein AB6A40_007147 [Gnathostoma spinigerum]|uniref:Uncharacterized protein n=1 Tax=Gnathostoma spinigerum TaxID=75299 RepID=A0ABD6EKD1_9BILA